MATFAITPLSQLNKPSVATPGIVPITTMQQQPTAPSAPSTGGMVRRPGTTTQAQPQGPTDLQNAQQANTMLQSAGKLGELFAPGSTKDLLGTGVNLQDLTGPLSLAQGIQQGNPLAAASGGIKTLSSLARIADMPGTSRAIGSLQGPLGLAGGILKGDPLGAAAGGLQTLGSIANFAGMPALGGAIGSLAGPLALYQGIQSGNPLGIAQGAIGTYGALSTLTGLAAQAGILPSALPSLSSLISSGISAIAPNVASALGIGAGAAIGSGTAAAAAGGATAGSIGAAAMGGSVAGGAATGIGASAGALGASATAGIFMAPLAIGYLATSIGNMIDAESAMRRERARQQRFQRGLPTMAQDLQRGADLMTKLTPQATDADLLKSYETLNTMSRNWEGGPATGNPKAPSFPAMIGGMSDAGRTTQEKLDPYLAQIALGQIRAEDLMRQRGMTIPGGGRYTPDAVAKLLGGSSSGYDPESGSFLGMKAYRSTNPWIIKNLLNPSAEEYHRLRSQYDAQVAQAKSAFGDDWEGAVASWQGQQDARPPDPRTIFKWSPEATAAFAAIPLGHMEEGVRKLLGLAPGTYGSAIPVQTTRYGALNIPTFGPSSITEPVARYTPPAKPAANPYALDTSGQPLHPEAWGTMGGGV